MSDIRESVASTTDVKESVVSPDIRKGLVGVAVDVTTISKVNPETNSLLYRGYPVQELAARCSVEQVALLLWDGELPDDARLSEFSTRERNNRSLSELSKSVIDSLPISSHPMDVCRTLVSVLGAADKRGDENENSSDIAKDLFARMPAIVAYDQRRRRGLGVVEAREDLDWAHNFLWMTFGKEADPIVVDAFRVSMILYAEHSFNASTFTARVITSTLSDMYSSVTGAIGALKGRLHGGANEAVMRIFEEIGDPDKAREWLAKALARKEKIMGFGHRVYKNGDSRVPAMRGALESLITLFGREDIGQMYQTLESAMRESKNILPNLELPAGPAYHLMGFDTVMFTPLFVTARIMGWTAHIMEQQAENALIRPVSVYTGTEERHLPPLE